MGEGWSEQKNLIPSNGPSLHPDRRMQLKLGDLSPCNVTHRDQRKPLPLDLGDLAATTDKLRGQGYLLEPPRELSDRELLRVAFHMARERLLDGVDAAIAEVMRRGGK